MALPIRAGTVNTLNLGPALNIGTGVAMGSLNLAPSGIYLSKNGSRDAVKADANTAYHDRAGWYLVPVSAADTETGGRLVVKASPTSCLELWQEYEVMSQPYYDALYAGSSSLTVLAVAASLPNFSYQAIANSVWQAPSRFVHDSSIAAFSVQAIANSVWQAATRALTDKVDFALTAAYDPAKTAAQAGNQMDFVNAPNATAITAIQLGLALQASLIVAANSVWNNPTREVVATGASIPGFSFQAVANSVWSHILTGTLQAQQIQRGLIAVMAGKSSGGNTDTIRFRNIGDTTDVVVATMNTSTGDRTAITVTLT